jgi:hypothetical protein
MQGVSKYPPAEPEARLLAYQRGLIAIVKSQTRELSLSLRLFQGSGTLRFPAASKLPALNRAYYWNSQTSTASPAEPANSRLD